MKLPVCLVTGASGYVGAHIVSHLLSTGNYMVRGTVRDPENSAKTAHLTSLQGSDRLTLVKADLADSVDAWEAVVKGCDYVIHSASPFTVSPKDPMKDLVIPARDGTISVLEAVKRVNSKGKKGSKVKKVVLTSSIAAIMADKSDQPAGHVYSEADWNAVSSLSYQPYQYSKAEAERAAWELHKDGSFEMCTVNPGFVFGPALSKTASTSITFVTDLLSGKFRTGVMDDRHAVVDVRDVAVAHRLALENGIDGERYLCCHGSGEGMNFLDYAESIKRTRPEYKSRLPTRNFPKPVLYLVGPLRGFSWWSTYQNVGVPLNYSVDKIEKIGMQWTDIDNMFCDMVKSLEDAKAVTPP